MAAMQGTKPHKIRRAKFQNFNDMLADVDAMLQSGYTRHGNWTLGQACSHIADWMRFPLDGFPKVPLPMRAIMWVMKHTVAPGMRRKILAEGFQGGMPTAPVTVPRAEEVTDQQGAEKLRETVDRLLSYDGPLQPSPLFGPMDKPTLIQVSLLHAEHHLSYLAPK